MNPKVDFYFSKAEKWKNEFAALRKIILDCGLTEELKWGSPCYMFEKKNIVLIHGFKEYCALLFFKGALLKDDRNILVHQTNNVQAARQIRFTSVAQVNKLKTAVKAYIYQAVAIEEAGLKVEMKRTEDFERPVELDQEFKRDKKFKSAFDALTPGRQRGYMLFFGSAKQSKTREARIEKYKKQIIQGKGLND